MATVLVHPLASFRPTNMSAAARGLISTAHQSTRFGGLWRPSYTVRSVAEESSSSSSSLDVGDDEVIKTELFEAIKGINRGIFGVPSAKKSQIEALVNQLESRNPTPDPVLNLQKHNYYFRFKKDKAGIEGLHLLGDFFQNINIAKGKAVNVIKFKVRGLNLFNGRLTIGASFKKASNSRVDVNYDNSTISPSRWMYVFKKNYDILLGIFNPEGWLEITYVDDALRIGRDDKCNIFILERSHESSL